MKQRNTKRRRYLRAAARCASGGVRDAVASKWTDAKQRRHDDRKLGTFGAASPVRIIMKDGKRIDDGGTFRLSAEGLARSACPPEGGLNYRALGPRTGQGSFPQNHVNK
jgi:hypothetical protein